ncbi:MAG TPA: hypothetical protein VK502_04300 [Candidatus Saccharimonadales bacterium]|nr:hypothetical protein [Candidatus Saccharimonadales bacterium]
MNLLPIPPALAVVFGALLLAAILKLIGNKVEAESHPVLDRAIDVATVLASTTVITGLITTPLVSSFSALGKKLIDNVSANTSQALGVGINIVTAVVTVGLLIWLFKRYEKDEKVLDLLILSVVLLVAGTAFPYVNSVLQAWVGYPVAFVWNTGVTIFNTVSNVHFSV